MKQSGPDLTRLWTVTVKNRYEMDQSLTILLTLIGSLKANLLNVQTEVLWHQRCSIQVKSFSSIFPFKNPTGAPQGAPFLPS